MENINGKVVAITGAGSGIGRATALALGRHGARVVLGGRGLDKIDAVAGEIRAAGGMAACRQMDVRDRASMQALVDHACATFGRLDVLVANAGVGPLSTLDDLREADWNDMIDVNFKGVLNGIGAALPVFRRQDAGHFVTVVSTAGLRVVPGMAVYAATKNAVRTLLEGLRQEAGPSLRVTGVSPGYVRTAFGDAMPDGPMRDAAIRTMEAIAISPDAVARAICFAIAQPDDVDIGDIVIRPTAQG